jgi:hypothetical protein
MSYARGTDSSFQIGLESVYGTAVTPTNMVNFLSESLKLDIERVVEDSILSSRTARQMDVMKYSTSGDFSVIIKPENLKELLYLSLGAESAPALKNGTTGVYEHEFTLIDGSTSLPSFTAVVDRKVATPAYTGNKVSSLSLDAKPSDYIRATVNVKGRAEEAGSLNGAITTPQKKSFRFVNGTLTIDGAEFADVTSVNISIDNALDDGVQTLGTGYYTSEMEHSERVINVDFECLYNSASDTIREDKYKVDGASANIFLTFETPEEIETGEKFTFTVALPNVVIQEAHPNISGKDRINLNLKGQALEPVGGEAITITIFDDDDAKSFDQT